MTFIIGHYGEDKNIPFGGQKLSYRVENLPLVEDRRLYNIYSGFLKSLKILDFMIIFLKKMIF